MLVIPAIDLKDGKCVRLRQGDMGQETRYSDDPPQMARHWEQLGAQHLHLVDLNGAVEGHPQNFSQIEAILKAVSIPVQVGGGIRSLDTIRTYLQSGISKVVLGTAALEDPGLLAKACEEFPSRIVLGLDVRQGKVAVHGWTNLSDTAPEHVLTTLSPYPLSGLIYTDITRDGMLNGPNLPALQTMATSSPFPIIASGGITHVGDIRAIRSLGPRITGVIIGKALYEGTLDLRAAIEAAESNPAENKPC